MAKVSLICNWLFQQQNKLRDYTSITANNGPGSNARAGERELPADLLVLFFSWHLNPALGRERLSGSRVAAQLSIPALRPAPAQISQRSISADDFGYEVGEVAAVCNGAGGDGWGGGLLSSETRAPRGDH